MSPGPICFPDNLIQQYFILSHTAFKTWKNTLGIVLFEMTKLNAWSVIFCLLLVSLYLRAALLSSVQQYNLESGLRPLFTTKQPTIAQNSNAILSNKCEFYADPIFISKISCVNAVIEYEFNCFNFSWSTTSHS